MPPHVSHVVTAALQAPHSPSLVSVLRRLVWRDVALASVLFLIESAATLVTPVAVYELLTWVENPVDGAARGAVIVIILAAAAATSYAADYVSDRVSKRAGVTCRAAVSGALFDKMVRARVVEEARANSGAVTSLFQVDALALAEYWHGLLGLTLQPVEIVGNVALLYNYVGAAALGGVAVVVAAMVITAVCGHALEAIAARRAGVGDLRTRDTNEMLLGMKVVKMNGWEDKFAGVIAGRRGEEDAAASAVGRYLSVVNPTSSNSVDVISLAVILLYTLALGRTLSPAIVFTYWVLLGLLHARIFHYPAFLKYTKEGATALKRLEAYLRLPEAPEWRVLQPAVDDPHTQPALIIEGGRFGWRAPPPRDDSAAPDAPPNTDTTAPAPAPGAVLTGVNLSVEAGEMVAVVGPVGCGKTTLLLSALGETRHAGGSVTLRGVTPDQVAYVPQVPWIFPGTARDNVLFGKPYDAARYAAVVAACALERDFSLWPRGDATNIGAMTISGGQRQRIALARAAYHDARIVLLDDCLSALDQRVGRAVLADCLQGIMGSAARLVVTNSSAVASAATRICLMVPTLPCSGSGSADEAATSSGGGGAAGVASTPLTATGGADGSSSCSSGEAHGAYTCIVGTLAALRADPRAAPALAAYLATAASVDEAGAGADAGTNGGEDVIMRTPSLAERVASELTAEADGAGAPALVTSRTAIGGGDGCAAVVEAARRASALMLSLTDAADTAPGAASDAVSAPAAAADTTAPTPSGDGKPVLGGSNEREEGASHAGASKEALRFFDSWLLGVGGWGYAAGVMFFLAAEAVCVEVGVYWLAWWSEDPNGANRSFNTYMWGYIGFVLGELAAAYFRQLFYVRGTIVAGTALHDTLLGALTRAPMRVFDTTPASHLLTWFSRDLHHLDPGTFYASEYFWLGIVSSTLILFVQAIISVWVLVPCAVVGGLLWFTMKEGADAVAADSAGAGSAATTAATPQPNDGGGRTCARGPSLASLLVGETQAKLPLADHVGTCLEGGASVRAFDAGTALSATYHALLDAHNARWLRALAAQSRQVFRGNMLGTLFYVGTVALIVPLRLRDDGSITAGGAGFIIVNSCFAASMLNLVIEHYAALASLAYTRGQLLAKVVDMPVEGGGVVGSAAAAAAWDEHSARLAYYGRAVAAMRRPRGLCASSTADTVPRHLPPAMVRPPPAGGWPGAGAVTFRDVEMRYSAGGHLVLRGVSLTLAAGTHVGVVGRTGAGKSSMVAAMTRLVELSGGAVEVDGVSIASVPLATLRTALTVISQEPLFVSGTLRRNLDPFGERTDAELESVLHAVRLWDAVSAQARAHGVAPLDTVVAERGANLSLGEQQLLAAARAWLRRPRVLIMDEASASLDAASEALLQDTVREAFADATVIQIAHRLASVMRCHLVVVMEAGRVAEVGHPATLLARPGSSFAAMVAATPPAEAAALTAAGLAAVAVDAPRLAALGIDH